MDGGKFADYWINPYGECRGKRVRALKPIKQGNGYLRYNLSYRDENGKAKAKAMDIHRLVAHEFISPAKEGIQVNHKDLNKENNCVDNLEFATELDNKRHYCRSARKTFIDERRLHGILLRLESGEDRKEVLDSCGIDGKALLHSFSTKVNSNVVDERRKALGLTNREYRKLIGGSSRVSQREKEEIVRLRESGLLWKQVAYEAKRDESTCKRVYRNESPSRGYWSRLSR